MANYLDVNCYGNLGKCKISCSSISMIAGFAVEKLDAVTFAAKRTSKKETEKRTKLPFNINNKVKCSISHEGNAQVEVNVDIKKGFKVDDVCLNIQKAIADDLETMIEQIPYSIKVKIEHII